MNQEPLPAGWSVRQGTHADIPFLAWCNYEATSPAPGFCYWDPLLADTSTATLAFIEAVLAVDALAWGRCEEFLILEERGRPLGGASGFTMDSANYRPLRLDRLPAVAQGLKALITLVGSRTTNPARAAEARRIIDVVLADTEA